MNLRQKLLYTGLGGAIMLIGILSANLIPSLTAQKYTFGEITCTGLKVANPEGDVTLELGFNELGGRIEVRETTYNSTCVTIKVVPRGGSVAVFGANNGDGTAFMFIDEHGGHVNVLGQAGTELTGYASMNTDKHGGVFSASGAANSSQANMGIGARGGYVHVFGEGKGGKRATMAVDEQGGYVDVFGKGKNEGMATINLNRHGGRVMVFGRGMDGEQAGVKVNEHGGIVAVYGKDNAGASRAVMGVNEHGNGAIATWDKNGFLQE